MVASAAMSSLRVPARSSFALVGLGFVGVALGASACSSIPTFPSIEGDAGIECGEDRACGSGEVCLEGHCYAECDPGDCGPLEVCIEGICVDPSAVDAGPFDAGPRDAGPPDAGPPDPCVEAACSGETPLCRAGVCLQCDETSRDLCGGATTVCDVAYGSCVAYAPAVCAACNNDADCGGAGTCVTRGGATEPTERVCLPSCTAGCPQGFTCGTGDVCVPLLGVSCTQYRAGINHQGCATEADCAPVGATVDTGLFNGSCVVNVCRIPCGSSSDCPVEVPTCDGSFYCI